MIIFAKYGEYDRRELLEECLTKYLETMKKTKLEGELTELKNHNDKPYFKDYPDVRFSISHSGALVVVAMAQTEVGIDIEEFRPRAYQKVVENVFTKGEAKEVKDLETFLVVWTRKEAYLKLTSEGLSGVRSNDVSGDLFYEGKRVVATPLNIFAGYVGTVVAEDQPVILVDLD